MAASPQSAVNVTSTRLDLQASQNLRVKDGDVSWLTWPAHRSLNSQAGKLLSESSPLIFKLGGDLLPALLAPDLQP